MESGAGDLDADEAGEPPSLGRGGEGRAGAGAGAGPGTPGRDSVLGGTGAGSPVRAVSPIATDRSSGIRGTGGTSGRHAAASSPAGRIAQRTAVEAARQSADRAAMFRGSGPYYP